MVVSNGNDIKAASGGGTPDAYITPLLRSEAMSQPIVNGAARAGNRPIPSPTEAAWMAGFVDGEGALMITKQVRIGRPSPAYRVNIQVANTKTASLDVFVRFYGGEVYSIHKYREQEIAGRWADAFSWRCPTVSTVDFLNDVAPYLVIKRPQADVLAEFMRTAKGFKRGKRLPGRHGGSAPLLMDEIEHRERLRQLVRTMNRRGKVA